MPTLPRSPYAPITPEEAIHLAEELRAVNLADNEASHAVRDRVFGLTGGCSPYSMQWYAALSLSVTIEEAHRAMEIVAAGSEAIAEHLTRVAKTVRAEGLGALDLGRGNVLGGVVFNDVVTQAAVANALRAQVKYAVQSFVAVLTLPEAEHPLGTVKRHNEEAEARRREAAAIEAKAGRKSRRRP